MLVMLPFSPSVADIRHPQTCIYPNVWLGSRLSFPATEPPDPRRVSEGVSEGVSKGSLKGLRRVLEGF